MNYKIPIMIPTYGEEEINEVLDSLRSTMVTMGKKVGKFEELWADYIGTKYALMVNSGSSANLLAHTVLTNPGLKRRIRPGDEIITPAVTWPTTAYPIVNVGAKPVFIDVELGTFDLDPEQLERAYSAKTVGVTFVHLLGNPCNMRRIMAFAKKHDLLLIEDACNAHGAEYEGKKCGSFGDMGTFSFFFSHIISTIEGGMVTTDSRELYELAKSIRGFGWVRGLASEEEHARKYPFVDRRFLFANIGFNFRPTDLQGAFGIHQIKRLDGFIKIRRANAAFWLDGLRRFEKYLLLPTTTKGGEHVWHHFPVTVKPGAPFSRKQIMDFLESKGVETRPISAGNMTEQPAFKLMHARKVGKLPNASLIMRNSFEWGNHHGIGEKERSFVVDCIGEFIRANT